MVYKVIGLMSGSSLDGLDIVYVHLQEGVSTIKDSPRKWEYTILHADCYPYTEEWRNKLATARDLSAGEYLLLHTAYGNYLGEQVLRFIETHNLHYQVQLIASHGHTTFHLPQQKMTAQLGDGAALAAATKINVVSDLRAMDVALGGQGAPIVPVGEKMLLGDYTYFLNLGGIANISVHGVRGRGQGGWGMEDQGGSGSGGQGVFVGFDVCPANRVLNELAALAGREFDANGEMAAGGRVDEGLLRRLNELPYYHQPYPKSLANEFGTETVLPAVREAMGRTTGVGHGGWAVEESGGGHGAGLSGEDALRTYVEHIGVQVRRAVEEMVQKGKEVEEVSQDGGPAGAGQSDVAAEGTARTASKMLVTGGGAHNKFLMERLRELLAPLGVEVIVPDGQLVDYKEALVMALIGVLRWREENNVFASVTGASRDSIGGAVWIGQEA
jgi:anhydro-N-acetylmuramic acid kinase